MEHQFFFFFAILRDTSNASRVLSVDFVIPWGSSASFSLVLATDPLCNTLGVCGLAWTRSLPSRGGELRGEKEQWQRSGHDLRQTEWEPLIRFIESIVVCEA